MSRSVPWERDNLGARITVSYADESDDGPARGRYRALGIVMAAYNGLALAR